MTKRRSIKSTTTTEKVAAVRKPTQIDKTIECTTNSSYIIEHPSITEFKTTILLNGTPIENEISNTNGTYKGIRMVKKNTNFIIYTGKHGLDSKEDTTSGILTIQFMEI